MHPGHARSDLAYNYFNEFNELTSISFKYRSLESAFSLDSSRISLIAVAMWPLIFAYSLRKPRNWIQQN